MEKQEYLKEVGVIYDTLVCAINAYNEHKISKKDFQNIVRVCWMAAPKEYTLIDEELAVTFELDASYIGDVISVVDFLGYGDLETYKDYVDGLIADFPNWDDSKFSVRGSNSLIPTIIGEPEWHWFAFGHRC